MLLGLRARAEIHGDSPGCGATDIDAPHGADGTERLLISLVAGSEGEGRLLGAPRLWHVSLADARAIVGLVGGLSDHNASRLSSAKQSAERIVRDTRAWRAIEEVAAILEARGVVEHEAVVQAVQRQGLTPASFGVDGGGR